MRFLATSSHMCCAELALIKGCSAPAPAVKASYYPGDMSVRMRKVLAKPWVGVRVCHLLLLFFSPF